MFPKDLLDALAAKEAVAVIGSGLSVAAGLPSWKHLLELMIRECEDQVFDFQDSEELLGLLEQEHFLEVADECCSRLGKPLYRDFIQRTFRPLKIKPTAIHSVLLQLPFSAVLTTNYDNLIEHALWKTKSIKGFLPVYTQKNEAQLAQLAGERKFFILKMHGHVDDIDTIVLTRRDYQDIVYMNPAYRRTLSTLLATRTLVFVGYGLQDPDLNFILDEQTALYKNFGRRHFAIMPNPGHILGKSFCERFNIEVIPYNPKNKHAELLTVLSVLLKDYKKHFRMTTNRGKIRQKAHKVPDGLRRIWDLAQNINDVIFQLDENAKWSFINAAWTKITGYQVEETLSKDYQEYIHPEDRLRHWSIFRKMLCDETYECRDQTRFVVKDGSYRWVEVTSRKSESGQGAFGTIRDITDLKRSETEKQRLAAFVRYNPNAVFEFSQNGNLLYYNESAMAMAEDLGYKDPEKILPANVESIIQKCLATGQNKLQQESTLGGRIFSWTFFPIVENRVVHCYASDITAQINLETQYRQSQKMESIGQLAAGVAHDFNNILTIIQGHADRLERKLLGEPAIEEGLNQISLAAQRAASLTRQLLMFSRKQLVQPRILDLNTILGNMMRMLCRLLGEDISLELSYAPDLSPIEADPGMIEQVIMNLAVNARDAMPKGGHLLITTAKVMVEDAYVSHHPESRAGTFVCLTIADTGCGMDSGTLTRIFEPFFTTKEVGKGTGLGLSTVYGIVKQHQGWLEVSSQIQVGTTFKIYFPASATKLEKTGEKDILPIRGGTETILLVEDETLLRELTCAILKDYDYNVLTASDGVEALNIWHKHKDDIKLVLTDMIMPKGIYGSQVCEAIAAEKPDIKIIYMSGYSMEAMGKATILTEGINFLQKPFHASKLAQIVRKVLDSGTT